MRSHHPRCLWSVSQPMNSTQRHSISRFSKVPSFDFTRLLIKCRTEAYTLSILRRNRVTICLNHYSICNSYIVLLVAVGKIVPQFQPIVPQFLTNQKHEKQWHLIVSRLHQIVPQFFSNFITKFWDYFQYFSL